MSPDTITAAAGAVVAIGAAIGGGFKFILDRIERAQAVAAQQLDEVHTRSAQMVPNGGSSLADAVRRIETKMDTQTILQAESTAVIRERLAVVEQAASKTAHDVVNIRMSVNGLAEFLPRRVEPTSE